MAIRCGVTGLDTDAIWLEAVYVEIRLSDGADLVADMPQQPLYASLEHRDIHISKQSPGRGGCAVCHAAFRRAGSKRYWLLALSTLKSNDTSRRLESNEVWEDMIVSCVP